MIFRILEKEKKLLLRQAPEFRDAVKTIRLRSFACAPDLFQALVQSIVSQQLAVKAADAIYARLEKLLGKLTPENLNDASDEALRTCGLSMRKIEYLRGIAQAVLTNTLDLHALRKMDDQAVIRELVKLKGVGEWTAEMLLIFALGRRDVLSAKDLGIQRGIMLLNHLDKLTPEEFARFKKRYSPCGTLASLYLWRIKDGGLSIGK